MTDDMLREANVGDLVQRYEDAHPCERWVLADGTRAWMTGTDCAGCGLPMATDGGEPWCTSAGCTDSPYDRKALAGSGQNG